jgi:hypothetical protein
MTPTKKHATTVAVILTLLSIPLWWKVALGLAALGVCA